MCGCVSEWSTRIHVNMFRHLVLSDWNTKLGISQGSSVWTATKCGFPPQRNVCIYVGSAKGDNVSPFHDTQSYQFVALQQFFVFFFCSKTPPDQTCLTIIIFFTHTHANVKRLAPALIYYTTVIVILSLNTLASFSLFFFLPSVFPIINLLCLAGFYWFSLYVARLWSLKNMIYLVLDWLTVKHTFMHILYSHDRRGRLEVKEWGPTGGEYEVEIIYLLLHLHHDHFGIFFPL